VTDPPKPRAKDLSQMQLFNETVNRLRRRKFVHDMVTKPSGVTISGRIGERIKAEIRGPDEEAVDAMILALRLLKQNDPTSLRRMAQLYERLPVESPHKTYFLDARAMPNSTKSRNYYTSDARRKPGRSSTGSDSPIAEFSTCSSTAKEPTRIRS